MPKLTKSTSRFATREEWLNAFIVASRAAFKKAGAPLPRNLRASIGFPSTGARGKAIGQCWSAGASADSHFEIFMHPRLQSSSPRIADILTHELVHAAVGLEAGHGAKFAKVAKALGLVGRMTATTAGPGWHAWADPILTDLGPMPGADLVAAGGPKKQAARLIKIECDSCDIVARVSRKVIDQCGGIMTCLDHECTGQMNEAGADNHQPARLAA